MTTPDYLRSESSSKTAYNIALINSSENMPANNSDDIDPEEYVRRNREEIISIIRSSDDPFIRACAWALLDKHTPEVDIEQLHEELDSVARQGERE